MKRKILAYACDHNYFRYTKASFASFCNHHSLSEWRVIFANVGMYEWQRAELARFGEVHEYPPSNVPQQFNIVYSSSRARLKMLTEFVDDDTILLYIDSDTLIFENVDKLISQFISSGKPIAIAVEDIDEFPRKPASYAWRDHKIPEEFRNQDKWRSEPIINAGVVLAQGIWVREFGQTAFDLYERYETQVWLAEQAIIITLLYDREIPYMKLPLKYHCFALENFISHEGTGPRYVGTRPFYRGESVAIRHFVGPARECKYALDEAIPLLDADTRLSKVFPSNCINVVSH